MADASESTRPNSVDLNRIFVVLNAIVAIASLVAFVDGGGNDFVNGETVVLSTMLAVQTHLVLMIERRRRDPFVMLTVFILIFYFSLRILTLLLLPFSIVFGRFPYTVSDSNIALVFILISNVFLYAGFYSVRGSRDLRIGVEGWRPTSPVRTGATVAIVVTIIYSRGILWNPDSLPRVLQALFVFASQSVVVLMAMAYFVMFRRDMSLVMRTAFLVLLLAEMVLHTLNGSRSAFVYALQNIMIVVLAVYGMIAIRRSTIFTGLVTLPISATLLVIAFVVSTAVTSFRAGGGDFSFGRAIDLGTQVSSRVDRDYAVDVGLPLIFARAGFFDFSAEIIAHRAAYEPVVNLPAYARSIIDNLLTPGFDVFDQPKIANALRFVYADRGKPSKIASAEEYQSDQLGIYGDFFVLFGWASLPVFFLAACLIKRLYFAWHDTNPFLATMQRVVVLSTWAQVMNSFGLDWVVAETVPLIVAIYVYQFFFAAKPRLMPDSLPQLA
jgi:hypothetical protein